MYACISSIYICICYCCLVTKLYPSVLQPHGLYVTCQAPLSMGLYMYNIYIYILVITPPLQSPDGGHDAATPIPVPPAVQPPGAPPVRDLGSVPPELTAGHQSFHMAMANPNGKVSSCNMEDPGLIPGLGRSPGEGNDNPLQYSCLENPMDGGAW